MSNKITLGNISSGYDLSKINTNFQTIQDELNNRVLYRSVESGETNTLEDDIDCNGKRLYNLGGISLEGFADLVVLTEEAQDSADAALAAKVDAEQAALAAAEARDSVYGDLASTAAGKGAELIALDDGSSGTLWTTIKGFVAKIRSSAGSSIVGFIQAGTGSVARFIQDKLRESVSVRDFGAKLDGVSDDGFFIQAALNARSASGGGDVLIDGIAVSTISITIPEGVLLRGIGRGYNKKPISGILFKGTGLRDKSIPNATAITVANPDVGTAYLADSGTRGDTYGTIDFSANFSAAVVLSRASGMRDMAVLPWFDGTEGYRGTDNRMADSWDVGIWARNSSGWRLNNIMSDGQWRKAGLLVSSSSIGDGKVPENELGEASFCLFGGARAVSIRTPRNTPVTNYGFAGTDFINCYLRSFDHQSAHLATSSYLAEPQATPSACLEMDGPQALRGIQFVNSTFVGRDDVCMLFGDVDEILFDGCYSESRGIKVSGAWLSNTLGSRVIATSDSKSVLFHSCTKYGVDFSPYFTADSSLTGQRYTNPGVYNPYTSQDSEWERPNFSASHGTRLRSGAAWRLYDSAFNSIASISETGGLTVGRTAVTTPESSDGNVFSGTYTPTLSNTLNIEATTAAACQYMRVGNVVTVSGQVNVDPTATGEVQVGISLPIASNFSSQSQCAGTSQTDSSTISQPGIIKGDPVNNCALLRFVSTSAANVTHMFSFSYQVL